MKQKSKCVWLISAHYCKADQLVLVYLSDQEVLSKEVDQRVFSLDGVSLGSWFFAPSLHWQNWHVPIR